MMCGVYYSKSLDFLPVWGEDSVNHGWLCTGEYVKNTPWVYNLYEIVCERAFNSNKAAKMHLRYVFIIQTLQNSYTNYIPQITFIFTPSHISFSYSSSSSIHTLHSLCPHLSCKIFITYVSSTLFSFSSIEYKCPTCIIYI